ncbi:MULTISPECIES: RidA family protein [unclassified Paraburkholderia]|uniref:RidA family protein n=1 Tax=unclassified Paraburkholderia TaxID=2615204 RepID=UPI002AAF9A8C|nr:MULTISPECIES: RidA family protein [unclassified Paraburkholderia]
MTIETRLKALGLTLPEAPQPLGSYTAASEAGKLLFISGQVPLVNGKMAFSGQIGRDLSLEDGRAAARITALNVLAQIARHVGGVAQLERLERIVRVEGHVSSTEGFYDQPAVLDGASELFAQVLRDKAGHARSAFSQTQLPENAALALVVIASLRPA